MIEPKAFRGKNDGRGRKGVGKEGGKGGRQPLDCLLNPTVPTTVLNSAKMPRFHQEGPKNAKSFSKEGLSNSFNGTLAFFLGEVELKM